MVLLVVVSTSSSVGSVVSALSVGSDVVVVGCMDGGLASSVYDDDSIVR